MKHQRLELSVLLLFGFGLTGLQAQESVNTSGGFASTSGGSASYSVGQVTYQIHTGTSGSVVEGVHQPYEISVVTGLDEAKSINLVVKVYPNPATDYLTLEVKDIDFPDLQFQLSDINGKLLLSDKITGYQTRVIMSNLIPAIYFVKILRGEKEVKTFKIIKN